MIGAPPPGSLPVEQTDPAGAAIANPVTPVGDLLGFGGAEGDQLARPGMSPDTTMRLYGATPGPGGYGWRSPNHYPDPGGAIRLHRMYPQFPANESMNVQPGGFQPVSASGDILHLAQQIAPSAQQPDLFDQAKQQYPILNNPDILYKSTPRPNSPMGLEAWPPTETGTPDSPRPKEFPTGKYGIEVYNTKTTRPIDVLGDVVSHFLVNTDPKIKDYYSRFSASISPEQEARLREQYRYSQKHEGEKRPYEEWREHSGLPAYFRGYPFQQWPKEFNDKAYTPEQKRLLDDMMKYLGGAK